MEEGTGNRDVEWERKFGKAYTTLKEMMTPEERKAAKRSILNAHYTARNVISGMWDAVRRLGFKGGRVLEPATGIGHFIGLMPDDIAANSETIQIDMDRLSARIAEKLYPD